MRASVRCRSLTLGGAGAYTLEAQEKHGKRLDNTSKQRRIREAGPIYFRSLDLRAEFDRHVEGAQRNAACRRPVLHFMIKFPDELLHGDAPRRFKQLKTVSERQGLMARQAIAFVNRTHGGDAVFAARLDRDETGLTTVDVFAAPRYAKVTRSGEAIWTSPTKFGKSLALRHQKEIRARFPDAKRPLTGPRSVGIALQAEFALFFEEINGVRLMPRTLKAKPAPDRLEIEAFKAVAEARAAVEGERFKFKTDRQILEARLARQVDQLREMAAAAVEDRKAAAVLRREAQKEHALAMALKERLAALARRLARWLRREDLTVEARRTGAEIGAQIINELEG